MLNCKKIRMKKLLLLLLLIPNLVMGGDIKSMTKYLTEHPNWQTEEPSLHYLKTRCLAANLVGGYMMISWSAYNKSDNADLIISKEQVMQGGERLFLIAESMIMFETFTPQFNEIGTWVKKNNSLYKVHRLLEKGISFDTLFEEIRDDLKLCNKVVLPYLVTDLINKYPENSKKNLEKSIENFTEEEKKRRKQYILEIRKKALEIRKKNEIKVKKR